MSLSTLAKNSKELRMSSPIATHARSRGKDALIRVHQKYSHNTRVRVLAKKIASILAGEFAGRKTISVLDIGCGDMQLAENIQRELPAVELTCVDIHLLPEALQADSRWKKYCQFDGRHLDFRSQEFDAAVFCDVLHHDYQGAKQLLMEAARVAKVVVVKDHFEDSFFSRWILKALDFVGNWGYGISLPKRYFRREEFVAICHTVGLEIQYLDNDIDLYCHIPLASRLVKPRLQFIALLLPHPSGLR